MHTLRVHDSLTLLRSNKPSMCAQVHTMTPAVISPDITCSWRNGHRLWCPQRSIAKSSNEIAATIPRGRLQALSTKPRIDSCEPWACIYRGDISTITLFDQPRSSSVSRFVVVAIAWNSTWIQFKVRLDAAHEHITIYSLASPPQRSTTIHICSYKSSVVKAWCQ